MRKGIVQLVAIGIVIAIGVTLVAVLFQWLPTSASEEFDRIQDIYWFATVMSIVIFALVSAVVVYSVWKWRVPPDDDAEGPPIHGHTGLEIVWTAVPAILVIALGIVSAVVLSENGQARDDALQVKAIGQQFAWKFEYSDYDELQSGELRSPRGPAGALHDGGGGCPPLVLGTELRSEDGCRPRYRDRDLRDTDAHGRVRGRLRRALRSRARHDACEGPRR